MPRTTRCGAAGLRPARRGFTLVELLVVVAVLAALAGISWPAIARTLGKNELRAAAKQVRAAILKARLRAVETGAAWQFGYWPGSGRCEARPVLPDEETQAPLPVLAAPEASPLDKAFEQTLPASIVFADPEADASRLAAAPPAGEEVVVAALFFPNGRGTDARLRLEGENRASIALAVRGLTGTVTIGPVEKEEAPP